MIGIINKLLIMTVSDQVTDNQQNNTDINIDCDKLNIQSDSEIEDSEKR